MESGKVMHAILMFYRPAFREANSKVLIVKKTERSCTSVAFGGL